MNLEKPDRISSHVALAYNFLKKIQISRIVSDPINFNDVLNDYIITMHKHYNIYQDRFRNDQKIKKKYKGKYHIENFQRIKKGKSVSNNEVELVKDFYEDLLKHIDIILNKKFYLGMIFCSEDIAVISKFKFPCDFLHELNQINIIIDIDATLSDKEYKMVGTLPWDLIDWNFRPHDFYKLAKKYKYQKIVDDTYFEGDCVALFFDNRNKQFEHLIMHNILDSCSNKICYKINYDQSNSKNLYIDIYRVDV
jgi:hypothetical protein